MAKPIQYCKVKNKIKYILKKNKRKNDINGRRKRWNVNHRPLQRNGRSEGSSCLQGPPKRLVGNAHVQCIHKPEHGTSLRCLGHTGWCFSAGVLLLRPQTLLCLCRLPSLFTTDTLTSEDFLGPQDTCHSLRHVALLLPSGCVKFEVLYLIVIKSSEGFPGGSDGKESACNTEDWVPSLGREDALKEGKATHFSILAWRIPWGCTVG